MILAQNISWASRKYLNLANWRVHTDFTMKKTFLEFIWEFVTDNKKQLFTELIEHRTRHIAVVLEDLYQPHNASAVMRTCDCFGIQDVHVIENRNPWAHSPDVERGSSKWISLYQHKAAENNTVSCLNSLKNKGYKLVATSPHTEMELHNLPLQEPVALIFGTEQDGVSDEAMALTDYQIRIPMYGFTESFNISVAAAIILHSLREKLQQSDVDWKLTPEQREDILVNWCKKVLKYCDKYHAEYQTRTKN